MNRGSKDRVRIGTRGSALARWQAEWVRGQLRRGGGDAELVLITTGGDADQRPIGSLGGQGVFTKEIQNALLEGRIDLAVHSLKDLPTDRVPGLILEAVPDRESPFDALISSASAGRDELPRGARVGTGSLRRRSQLLHQRPDLKMLDIRGNVETRLRKLDENEYDAIILAAAGLRRLGLEGRITRILPATSMLPAIGQGALGIECRTDDADTRTAVAALNDPRSRCSVLAERALLARLRGGCSAPIGAWARVDGGKLLLDATVLSPDGSQRLFAQAGGSPDDPESLALAVATELLEQGAEALIANARG